MARQLLAYVHLVQYDADAATTLIQALVAAHPSAVPERSAHVDADRALVALRGKSAGLHQRLEKTRG